MVYNSQMTPQPSQRKRKKRFERDPDHVPSMRLTQRDVAIIRHVSRHRFLNSKQIITLVGESPRIVRRLEAMFRCGYLDRPKAQLVYYGKAGSEPLVYALGRKGAHVLAETKPESEEAYRWTGKNKRVGQIHVQHTIEAADILVRLGTATTKSVRLITEDQILADAPPATREMASPTKLTTEVEWAGRRHKLSVIPDGLFALEFGDDILAPVERANYFLELDRETMPVMRKSKSLDKHNRQTSILSKLLTYHRAWRERQHVERFGWENFRVLTVTTSDTRVASMIEAVKAVTEGRGSSLFLFATQNALTTSDILDVEWTSGKGQRMRLVD
jgi:Replication-relaxation